jgi:hypothetical protein
MQLNQDINRYLIILSMFGMVSCSVMTKDPASRRSLPSEDNDSAQGLLDQEKSAKDRSRGSAEGTSSQASGVSGSSAQDSVANQGTAHSSENTPTDEPIQVTGAFLTCVKKTDLYCALDVAQDQPYQFKKDPEAKFYIEINNDESRIQESTAEYLPIGGRWHWKIQVTGGTLPTVTAVNLLLPNKKTGSTQYRQTFLMAPINIGDQRASTAQRGCSVETIAKAVYGGGSYTRPFKIVRSKPEVFVTIQRICGVEQNNTVVRIIKGGSVIKSEKLPESKDKEIDFVKKFDKLDEGDYILEVLPGRNPNDTVDNMFFYDLMLSL